MVDIIPINYIHTEILRKIMFHFRMLYEFKSLVVTILNTKNISQIVMQLKNSDAVNLKAVQGNLKV